ncbi:MAG: hypothetical protein IPH32_15615 [Bacteroidetes bacterium]|nr:hypothetical protein [Bacteroidota bacterium]
MDGVMETSGKLKVVTLIVLVLIQPKLPVPATVKFVVQRVFTGTEIKLPVAADGNNVNVFAPKFEKVTNPPIHTVFVLTFVNTLGRAITLTESNLELIQPKGLEPVIE